MRCNDRCAVRAVLVVLWLALAAIARASEPLAFHVTFDKSVSAEPFTGRVYVMLEYAPQPEPPFGLNWFRPAPFFAMDVAGWSPGEVVVIGPGALSFPAPLPQLESATYSIQAVMDFDRGHRDFCNAPGNGYSAVVRQQLDAAASGAIQLRIDKVVQPRPFEETDRVKLVDMQSDLLTEFHGRPVRLRAGVVLPESFRQDSPERYAVVYEIPGFGGNHFGAFRAATRNASDVAGVPMLYVVLDPGCRWGHHVFADSDNNGPVGRALLEELIPHIENRFGGIAESAARFVTGHSSGGWSSLWLQVTYPEFFGGVWSTSPDPVDFRDFSQIDIYDPDVNMFTDPLGNLRPIARSGGRPVVFVKPFSDMEVVMGHGGQFGSFEAVFSPRGRDGRPHQLWDRSTGKIDPRVAERWKRYDIRLILQRDWERLGPKLRGKLHVITGSEDTFYLEGAVVLLKKALEHLGGDATVEILPGRHHGNVRDAALRARIAREMAASFRKNR